MTPGTLKYSFRLAYPQTGMFTVTPINTIQRCALGSRHPLDHHLWLRPGSGISNIQHM